MVAQSAVNHALWSGGHKFESPLPLLLCGHVKKKKKKKNCDVAFNLLVILKANNDNFKFNSNFKSHITIEKVSREPLAFPFLICINLWKMLGVLP